MEQLLVEFLQAQAVKFPWLIAAYSLLPGIWMLVKAVAKLTKTQKDDKVVLTIENAVKKAKKK